VQPGRNRTQGANFNYYAENTAKGDFMKKAVLIVLLILSLLLLAFTEVNRRGCCSWHGGVCGCKGGRIVCCDGIYSPSCTCR
jgi:hypothetical protein